MLKKTLFPSPAPNFHDPIGLLGACHGRILRNCETLMKLVEHLQEKGLDDEARQTAARVHHYFATAGTHHHQDEEDDLFPLLARRSLKLAEMIHELRQDHIELDALWRELEPLLAEPEQLLDNPRFTSLVQQMNATYQRHVESENTGILPMAQDMFSDQELAQLGERMARRRGLDPDAC